MREPLLFGSLPLQGDECVGVLLEVLLQELDGNEGVAILRLFLEEVLALPDGAHAALAELRKEFEATAQIVSRAELRRAIGGEGGEAARGGQGGPGLRIAGGIVGCGPRAGLAHEVRVHGAVVAAGRGAGIVNATGDSGGRRVFLAAQLGQEGLVNLREEAAGAGAVEEGGDVVADAGGLLETCAHRRVQLLEADFTAEECVELCFQPCHVRPNHSLTSPGRSVHGGRIRHSGPGSQPVGWR